MGGAPCKIIINKAGEAMAVIGEFEEKGLSLHSKKISMTRLKAYVREAVDSISYTSLYFMVEQSYGVPAPEYTQPIIDDLDLIIHDLPNKNGRETEDFVNDICKSLRNNLNKLEELFKRPRL